MLPPGDSDEFHFVFGRPRAAPAAFTPASVSGLAIWLKADAEGYSNNASVTSWHDQSGNSYHATGSAGTQPTFKTGIQNGLPAINFNATIPGQYLTFGNILDNPTNLSFFVVFSATAQTGGALLTKLHWSNNDAGYGAYAVSRDTLWQASTGNYWFGDAGAATAYQDGVARIYNWTKGPSGANLKRYINNGADTNSISITGTPQENVSNAYSLYLGTTHDHVGALNFHGNMHELLIYTALPSTTERGNIFDFLNTKWAVY